MLEVMEWRNKRCNKFERRKKREIYAIMDILYYIGAITVGKNMPYGGYRIRVLVEVQGTYWDS